MIWQEVCILTNSDGLEYFTGQLLNLGVSGWVVEDPKDFNDFLNAKDKSWDYIDEKLMVRGTGEVKIIFYLADDTRGREQLQSFMELVEKLQQTKPAFGSLELTINKRKPSEWEDNWKQYYKPFTVGERLVIKPSWEEYQNDTGRKVLEIDPNSSFGTGQHHTTRICLELIEKLITPDSRVLDIGCGTGILSIGAMLLGASQAVAVDIEPHSAQTAQNNAVNNGISRESYLCYAGNILNDHTLVAKIGSGYTLIAANIVADVIIGMAELFYDFLQPGGKAVCSGIIVERLPEVIAGLKQAGFEIEQTKTEAGWVGLVVSK